MTIYVFVLFSSTGEMCDGNYSKSWKQEIDVGEIWKSEKRSSAKIYHSQAADYIWGNVWL